MTRAVLEELANGVTAHPRLADVDTLPWLERVAMDSLTELATFNQYVRILGSDSRNIGEAATLAWAERASAIALIDDDDAVRAGDVVPVLGDHALRVRIEHADAGHRDIDAAASVGGTLARKSPTLDAAAINATGRITGAIEAQNPGS